MGCGCGGNAVWQPQDASVQDSASAAQQPAARDGVRAWSPAGDAAAAQIADPASAYYHGSPPPGEA